MNWAQWIIVLIVGEALIQGLALLFHGDPSTRTTSYRVSVAGAHAVAAFAGTVVLLMIYGDAVWAWLGTL